MPLRDTVGRLGRIAGASASQVFSSLSNVVIVIAVGRGGGAPSLGRFTLAFGAYLIILGSCRALVSQPLLTLREKLRPRDAALGAAATATACLGAGSGVVCVVLGLGLGRPELAVVGLAMIPLCIQDLLRFAFFQVGRPWGAVLLDGIWLLVSLAAFPIIVSQGSPALAMSLWGAGALVAAVPGFLILKPRPVGLATSYKWWRSEARHLGLGLVLESIAYSIGSQAGLWVIVVLLGDGDLGLLKAAQTILGPAMMALAGFNMLAVPEMAQSGSRPSMRLMLRMSARALGLIAVAVTGLVWVGPWAARILFGSEMHLSRALLIPVAAQYAANSLAIGPTAALMVQRSGGTLALVRAGTMGVGIAATAVVCGPLGIVGAAWALALSSLLFAGGTAVAVPVVLRRTGSAAGPEDA